MTCPYGMGRLAVIFFIYMVLLMYQPTQQLYNKQISTIVLASVFKEEM
jgi:hypothetical protein